MRQPLSRNVAAPLTFVIAACLMLGLLVSFARTAPTAGAASVIIELNDGRSLQGELIDDSGATVVIEISGIRTPIPKEEIASITREKTIEERYRERREAINDDDVDERYGLAQWLYRERADKLAQQELVRLRERFPDDGRIRQLLVLVEARIKLLEEREQPPATVPPRPVPTTPTVTPTVPATPEAAPSPPRRRLNPENAELPTERLTPEQINLIRVYEIRLDPSVRVVVPNDVAQEFLRDYADAEGMPRGRDQLQEFRAAEGWQQLSIMFRVRARDYYSRVTVLTDPDPLAEFRRSVHRNYVLNYCGTAECHGGYNAQGMFLYRIQPTSVETIYTNFFILQKYADDRGYMINRDLPERSYLLQYGLPREEARTPHPPVEGMRSYFRNRDDRNYAMVQDWIRSLDAPTPDFPIQYTMPAVRLKEPGSSSTPDASPVEVPADAPSP